MRNRSLHNKFIGTIYREKQIFNNPASEVINEGADNMQSPQVAELCPISCFIFIIFFNQTHKKITVTIGKSHTEGRSFTFPGHLGCLTRSLASMQRGKL